jgi:hypothetical protein
MVKLDEMFVEEEQRALIRLRALPLGVRKALEEKGLLRGLFDPSSVIILALGGAIEVSGFVLTLEAIEALDFDIIERFSPA